jgi:hypothetical protein
MKRFLILLSLVAILFTVGCNDANVASYNISKAADNFEVFRRVVFYNGITDNYILSVEGYCSITDSGNKLSVTVKTENGKFIKHYLGLSDNVTYFSEQLQPSSVSDKRYRVTFKPSVIIPSIDVR